MVAVSGTGVQMHGPLATAPAEEALLRVTTSTVAPDTILCVVSGEIDAATGPELRQSLVDAVRRSPSRLVIDLTDVEFMASIGLDILAATHRAQHAAGHHLAVIVGHNYAATRPLQITGLDQSLDLHTDLATAIPGAAPGRNGFPTAAAVPRQCSA
jgi:anti-sigma B factor antagonist